MMNKINGTLRGRVDEVVGSIFALPDITQEWEIFRGYMATCPETVAEYLQAWRHLYEAKLKADTAYGRAIGLERRYKPEIDAKAALDNVNNAITLWNTVYVESNWPKDQVIAALEEQDPRR